MKRRGTIENVTGSEDKRERPAPLWSAARSRAAEHLEIGIGFLGFWSAVLVVAIIWLQLSGETPVGWALLLAVLVLAIWLMVRWRARAQRKAMQRSK